MMQVKIIHGLICCCLLLTLSGCGNKGPLVPPDEEPKKSKTETS